MATHREIAELLRRRMAGQKLTQAELREAAGISQRTLTNVLGGTHDFKLSTLLALADRLGLELVLVPKGARASLEPAGSDAPPARIPTRVDRALQRVRGSGR
ncbi:helix-turn-helix domain-containing protein [Bordetella sp. 2513F-2]